MCGIAGFWGEADDKNILINNARKMNSVLGHRGPDGEGYWVAEEEGIALCHTRLSIIDLSNDGAQPMVSSCDRYVITYNGEIYNYIELRKELEFEGAKFNGHSDTEVFLTGFVFWGIKKTLKKANGMFAFALWDKVKRCLYLGRDRLGKKPLYYGQINKTVVFGSELKVIRTINEFEAKVNTLAAAEYFQYGFIPNEKSIYEGINKLPQGHLMTIPSSNIEESICEPYWKIENVIHNGISQTFNGDIRDAENELERLLVDSILLRCRSDVPYGCFLSGGIDSSLIVSLMQEHGNGTVKTFTIGFSEQEYDETCHAEKVASRLGCEHESQYLEPEMLQDTLIELPLMYDEPFADLSQVPTLLVSKLASESVKVCLTGDGGDEVFGGYHRHFMAARYWPWIDKVPFVLRRSLSAVLIRYGYLGIRYLSLILEKLITSRNPEANFYKILAALHSENVEALHNIMISKDIHLLLQDNDALHNAYTHRYRYIPDDISIARRMMTMDTLSYLPDDILIKADRASMHCGLELRSPLLDHRIMDFSWKLPDKWIISEGRGKRILRNILTKYLPADLIEGQKKGFTVPISTWLRGPLKQWAEELLCTSNQDEYISSDITRIKWQEHINKKADHAQSLWRILMWLSWRKQWHV